MFFCVFLLIMGAPICIFADQPPNFVIILTDDQDLVLNSMVPLTNVKQLVANNGMTFTNYFVNSPICCPSRSTLLTGAYAHTVHVYNNSLAGNCSSQEWQRNFEPRTMAAILKDEKQYMTFYGGKYLNQYGDKAVGGVAHVPYGYDWWLGLVGNSKYYNYTLSINGTGRHFGSNYLTDQLADYSIEFLKQESVKRQPFFMIIAPPAPHAPFTPAPRHQNAFNDIRAPRTPSFNYTSNDKHWLVQMAPHSLPTDVTRLDEIHRNRWRTLLAVDELLARIVTQLQESAILERTYLIFTSDNGFHIGQFTQPWDKRQPYDTDIRVPLIIRGPSVKRNSLNNYAIAAIDLAPTILDLAGITDRHHEMDGVSFKDQLIENKMAPDIQDDDGGWEKMVFFEYWGEGSPQTVGPECNLGSAEDLAQCAAINWCKCQDARNNTYACVIDMAPPERQLKFCTFPGNYFEIYDLIKDPYELENIARKMAAPTIKYYKDIIARFTTQDISVF